MQDTDLTIVDNKITEISGVPLSAGDELPSGTMNTSALEYNAVNEISGYNGSAIAQYGAEKQWLVHDDTLVHAANSAQYALGVNLSAVAQLLGIDETVLFESTGNRAENSGTFSEPLSSFKYIEFYANRSNQDNNPNLAAYAKICTINGVPSVQLFHAGLLAGDSMFCPIAFCNLTNTTFNFVSARNVQVTTTGTTFNIPTTAFSNIGLQKAVGIGRRISG